MSWELHGAETEGLEGLRLERDWWQDWRGL